MFDNKLSALVAVVIVLAILAGSMYSRYAKTECVSSLAGKASAMEIIEVCK